MTERLHFHFSLSCIGEGNGNPLQCSCLENPRDGEPGGLPSMGSHRVGHDWCDLAAAAAADVLKKRKKTFPLFQHQMCVGLSTQQAIPQHSLMSYNLPWFWHYVPFWMYCQVPQFKGSVPGDCHWLHMSISGSRSPDYPQLLYDLAINQKFPKAASSGLMYLLEQLLKLREDECLLVE